jgi:hypothetical protein
MGGSREHRWSASSLDCSTPWAVSGVSVGMPVGFGVEVVYSPVWGLTVKFERNWVGC